MRTPTYDLHVAFEMSFIYNFITQLCRQQTKVVQNQENIRNVGQDEAIQRKYMGLKLGGGQSYDRSSD
jgi:hypothetical protein